MPLAYETRTPLDLTGLQYNTDGVAVILVTGGIYGGRWALNAWPMADGRPGEHPVGKIRTKQAPDGLDRGPGLAFDITHVWINDACVAAGAQLLGSQNDNDKRPEPEQPYTMAGRFVIARGPAAGE